MRVALRAAACGRALSCALLLSSSLSAHGEALQLVHSRAPWLRVRVCFLRATRPFTSARWPLQPWQIWRHDHGSPWSHGTGEAARSVCCTSADARPLISSRTPSLPQEPTPGALVSLAAAAAQTDPAPRDEKRDETRRDSWASGLRAPPSSSSNHRGNCQRLPAPLQSTVHGPPAASHVKFGIPWPSANDARRRCRKESLVVSCLALPCLAFRPADAEWERQSKDKSKPCRPAFTTRHSPLVVCEPGPGAAFPPAMRDPDAG